MKKLTAILLAVSLLLSLLPTVFAEEETVVFDASKMLGFRRTRQEVIERYNEAYAAGGSYSDRNEESYYNRMPSLSAPYDQGELKQDTLDAMIAMTNYIRWLVGTAPLQKGASNDDGLQRAALIRNFEFNHYVSDESKPADMDQDFWDSGKVWHNILAWGYNPRGSITGWCNEGYSLYNQSWDTVGHRYALISAELSALSLGYAGAIAIGRDDEYKNAMTNPFAAFPAPGPMPTQLVYAKSSAWSVELNGALFRIDDSAKLSVTVTDLGTGNAYECTNENGKLLGGAGSTRLIFVQPEPESYLDNYYYADGSSYQVRINGLTEISSGKPAELRYQVDFISIKEEMATTVTSCTLACGTKLFLPEALRDAASLEKLTGGMPDTVTATTQSGMSYEIPVLGGWSYDAAEKCWTAKADATALPKQVSDPDNLLEQVTIYASEEYGYTGYLSFSTSQFLLGKPGTISVGRYMLGTPVVRVYQIRPDGTTVLRFTEESPNCTNDTYSASFAIDAWTAEDSGTWFAIYGRDWIGGFLVGMQEVNVVCLHEHTREERVEPTCTEAGSADTYCEICGALLLHEVLKATGHDYQAEVKAATCTEAGFTTYTCTRCKDSYTADEVAALGHDYQPAVTEPTCTEAGFTTYTCTRCKDSYTADEVEALGHDYQPTVTAPTCTEAGFTTYTCTRCKDSYTADEVEALGHDWGEPSYTWSEDYRQLTAEAVCRNDPSHKLTETVLSSAASEDASCTEPGTVVFTAVFEDPTFESQTVTVTGVPMGHTVEEWTVIRAASCLDAGLRSGICTRCSETVEEEIPALGHDWDAPTYEWSEDNSTVTATHICKNDETHAETETVETSSEVTKEATVDEEGEITYTAEFTNPAFEKQTKAVAIPKLEPQKPTNPFDDVVEGKFYYDAVLWAVAHEPQITNGTDATHFSPDATCTRGQVVTFLWRAKGCPEPTKTDSPFTDVTGGFYYKAVLWAVENEITNGTSATTFGPNDGCTRGQVVTFLWRTEGKPEPTTENNPFEDVTGGFYYKAVLWAVENKITAGMDATHFAPMNTCTRGQIVTFLYRDLAE